MRKSLLIFLFIGLLVPVSGQIYVQISVTTPPVPLADAGADTSVSSGAQLMLMASVTGGTAPYTYQWSPGAQLNDSTILTPVLTATVTTIFTLHVTDANGCESSDEVVVNVSTVGMEEKWASSLNVYPNPASSSLIIQGLPPHAKKLELELMSIIGERVLVQNPSVGSSEVKWDVASLKPGLYLMRVIVDDQLIVKKITIR